MEKTEATEIARISEKPKNKIVEIMHYIKILMILVVVFFLIVFFNDGTRYQIIPVVTILALMSYWTIKILRGHFKKRGKFAKRRWFFVGIFLGFCVVELISTLRNVHPFYVSDWLAQSFWMIIQITGSLALIGLIIFIVAQLFSFKTSPHAERPDILASVKIKEKVKAASLPDDGVLAGFLEKQPIHISCEDRAVVIGPPGTGKTAFLVNQLLDWAKSGRPFIVNDIKPEIYGIVRTKLEKMGYRIFTYNPTSGTGQRYNFLDDIQSPESIGELAAALIPSIADENVVFYESARDLLDAIISHIKGTEKETGKSVSLTAVREFLSKFDDIKELLGELQNSPDVDAKEISGALSILAKNNRLFGSVFATLRANLRFLRYPKIRDSLASSDFSLKSFCKGKKVGLFLQFEETHQETTRMLFSVLISHILRYFIENNPTKPVLLLLDEIGNVPPVVGLVKKLNTIRSRQLPTWLYFQSKEQMQVYGRKFDEGANMIMGACDFQMVFRLNDNATAEWMSKKIGTVDRLITSVSGKGSLGLNATRTKSLLREPVIFPHDLQKLSNNQVIATYRGLAWRCEATPYYVVYPEYDNKFPKRADCLAKNYET